MAHNPTGAALHINLRQERRKLVIGNRAKLAIGNRPIPLWMGVLLTSASGDQTAVQIICRRLRCVEQERFCKSALWRW